MKKISTAQIRDIHFTQEECRSIPSRQKISHAIAGRGGNSTDSVKKENSEDKPVNVKS